MSASRSGHKPTFSAALSFIYTQTHARAHTRIHHVPSVSLSHKQHPEPCRHFPALSLASHLVSSSPHSLLLSLLLAPSPSSFSHRVAAPHLSLTSNNLCLRQHGAPVNTDARFGCLATCLPVSGRCQPQQKIQDQ